MPPEAAIWTQLGLAGIFFWLYVRSTKRADEKADAASKKCDEREIAMNARIQKQVDYARDTLGQLVAESNRTRDKSAVASENHAAAIVELAAAVRESRTGSGAHKATDHA
jgi:hypothetical protein